MQLRSRQGFSLVELVVIVAVVGGIALFSVTNILGTTRAPVDDPAARNPEKNAGASSDVANAQTMEAALRTASALGSLDADSNDIVTANEARTCIVEAGVGVAQCSRDDFEFYVDSITLKVVASQTGPAGYTQIIPIAVAP